VAARGWTPSGRGSLSKALLVGGEEHLLEAGLGPRAVEAHLGLRWEQVTPLTSRGRVRGGQETLPSSDPTWVT